MTSANIIELSSEHRRRTALREVAVEAVMQDTRCCKRLDIVRAAEVAADAIANHLESIAQEIRK